jgi:putative redox protein
MADMKKVAVRWIEGMEFETETESGHKAVIDAGVKAGGKNRGPSPMELLLLGLAGCTGMDVVDILRKKRLEVSGVEVRVEGTRAETHPMVYTDIDVVYTVKGKNIPESAVEQAIHLSEEKYCSAGVMLGKTAKIKHHYEIIAE